MPATFLPGRGRSSMHPLGGKTGSRLGSRAPKVVSKKVCNTNVVGSRCIPSSSYPKEVDLRCITFGAHSVSVSVEPLGVDLRCITFGILRGPAGGNSWPMHTPRGGKASAPRYAKVDPSGVKANVKLSVVINQQRCSTLLTP